MKGPDWYAFSHQSGPFAWGEGGEMEVGTLFDLYPVSYGNQLFHISPSLLQP